MSLVYQLNPPIVVGDMSKQITLTQLKLVSVSVNYEDIYAKKGTAILSLCLVDTQTGYPVNFVYQDTSALTMAQTIDGQVASELFTKLQLDNKLPPGSILSATSTILAVSPATPAAGATVTLTATVTSRSGTPVGDVVFTDGTTMLGTGTLNASGVATLTLTTLAAGAHQISAAYPVQSNGYAGSTSAVQTVTVA